MPLSFSNLGQFGELTFANVSAPIDTLIYNGTASNDNFSVESVAMSL